MKEVTLYIKASGELGPMLSNTGEAIAAMENDILGYVEGHWCAKDWCVDLDTLEVVARDIPLLDAKQEKWDYIKREREKRLCGGCMTPLGRVETDEKSRANISGAALMASLAQSAGAPFVQLWTMANNSVVEHDGLTMIAMGIAVGQHVSDVYARARDLRNEIAAATSISELEGIEWDAST